MKDYKDFNKALRILRQDMQLTDLQYKTLLKCLFCLQDKSFNVDLFLIWIANNYNCENSIFMRKWEIDERD